MNRIKFPTKCSDAELNSILANAEVRGYEFPYSRDKGRYLNIDDYLTERFFRDRNSRAQVEKKNQELNSVFSIMHKHDPDLHVLFRDAIQSCCKTEKPVELKLSDNSAGRRYKAFQLLSVSCFRAAMRRYAKCTVVITHSENIWLLPAKISAYDWILNQGGFTKRVLLKKNFPRAFSIFERLAEATHGSDDRCRSEKIDDPENLWQIINILAVYPRYYTVEDLFRVEFAFGRDNQLMARTLVFNPPEFIAFTSPTQFL